MLSPASAAGTPCARSLDPDVLPPAVRAHLTQRQVGVPGGGYVYDPAVAGDRARTLRLALPEWATLLFAVKANSFAPVLSALASPGGVDGFEVASAAEARAARAALAAAGRPPGAAPRLVAAGPAKHPALLAELLDLGVEVLHVESALELARVSAEGVRRGTVVPVAVRVNPARSLVAGALTMGGRATAFGVPEAEVPALLEQARSLPGVVVVGFHVHAVCGNRDAAAHVRYVEHCLNWAVGTARAHDLQLSWLDVGGGLGVSYGGHDPFELDRLGAGLAALDPPPGVRVGFEPGRWLAADCGWYVAEVVDVKRAYGTAYAVIRGGINAFALPATEDFPFPFAVVAVDAWPPGLPRPELGEEPVTVAGELCTPEDVLARDVQVPRVRAGDLVVFPQAGAYGWEFALQQFLGHPVARRDLVDPSLACPAPASAPLLEASA